MGGGRRSRLGGWRRYRLGGLWRLRLGDRHRRRPGDRRHYRLEDLWRYRFEGLWRLRLGDRLRYRLGDRRHLRLGGRQCRRVGRLSTAQGRSFSHRTSRYLVACPQVRSRRSFRTRALPGKCLHPSKCLHLSYGCAKAAGAMSRGPNLFYACVAWGSLACLPSVPDFLVFSSSALLDMPQRRSRHPTLQSFPSHLQPAAPPRRAHSFARRFTRRSPIRRALSANPVCRHKASRRVRCARPARCARPRSARLPVHRLPPLACPHPGKGG